MDDYLDSADSENYAINVIIDVIAYIIKGSFEMRN